MLERDVENALRKRVKELGGLCEKFTSPNKRNVPDDLVTLPGGIIIFVECKRPGERARKGQLRDHERRRNLGCDVRIIDSMEAVNAFPKELA